MTKKLTIPLLAMLLMFCGAIAAGLRINGTHSFPIGLYWVIGKQPEKGDLVFVNPPATALFSMAKERGYLNIGFSPTSHLIKRLVGVPGDRVTIDSAGVEVNGVRLANSAPLAKDGAGRALQFYPVQNYILGPNEVLLMSEYSPASFDARYFGPVQATTIESVLIPIVTWK